MKCHSITNAGNRTNLTLRFKLARCCGRYVFEIAEINPQCSTNGLKSLSAKRSVNL